MYGWDKKLIRLIKDFFLKELKAYLKAHQTTLTWTGKVINRSAYNKQVCTNHFKDISVINTESVML
jgi:hypothetical protein